MPMVGGLDIHRKQITFYYLDVETGQVCRGQISLRVTQDEHGGVTHDERVRSDIPDA